MITFIICSRDPEAAAATRRNISATIGPVTTEFVIFDNSRRKWGITRVYNHCARRAQASNLCFVHEDVFFHSRNWGPLIEEKLKEEDCGIIGFSGSAFKTRQLSPVHQSRRHCIHNLVQSGGAQRNFINTVPLSERADQWSPDFFPVITLDGLCLFMRKAVWEQTPFDEEILTGFHGYDLDISLAVAEYLRNYVCNCIVAEHTSMGNFSKDWATDIIRLHEQKWGARLPLYAGEEWRREMEAEIPDTYYQFLKNALRAKAPMRQILPYIKDYWRITHFGSHSTSLLLKLLASKLLRWNI